MNEEEKKRIQELAVGIAGIVAWGFGMALMTGSTQPKKKPFKDTPMPMMKITENGREYNYSDPLTEPTKFEHTPDTCTHPHGMTHCPWCGALEDDVPIKKRVDVLRVDTTAELIAQLQLCDPDARPYFGAFDGGHLFPVYTVMQEGDHDPLEKDCVVIYSKPGTEVLEGSAKKTKIIDGVNYELIDPPMPTPKDKAELTFDSWELELIKQWYKDVDFHTTSHPNDMALIQKIDAALLASMSGKEGGRE